MFVYVKSEEARTVFYQLWYQAGFFSTNGTGSNTDTANSCIDSQSDFSKFGTLIPTFPGIKKLFSFNSNIPELSISSFSRTDFHTDIAFAAPASISRI